MASILGQSDRTNTGTAGGIAVRYAPVLAVAIAVLGILAVYSDTVASIVAIWNRSETFAHGYVVVPICLWLAWRKRHAIAATPASPWFAALVVVAGAGALWLVMAVAEVIGVRQFALALMLQAAIVAVVGLRVARAIAFPLLFLLFAVPAGEFLVPTMIDRTADFTVAALRASGVPVYREVNHFIIPSGAWSVVEACSGLRYLIASVMIGVVYAAVNYRSPRRRAAFIAASVIVPLVANWLRAYMIVMIGHLSNNTLAVGVDHIIYGWLFFGVVMALLFWVGSFWSEDDSPAPVAEAEPLARSGDVPAGRFYAVAVAAIAVAAVWPPVYGALERAPSATPVKLAPLAPGGSWTPSATLPAGWVPSYSGFAAKLREGFSADRGAAGVHIAYYPDQRKGRELVTSTNQLVLAHEVRWKEIVRGDAVVTIDGAQHTAHRAVLLGNQERLVVYRMYWVDGRITASDYKAKALLAWSRLTGGSGDAALVVVFAMERDDRDVAREAFEALWPSIARTLAAAREGR